jgi:hypothetical protein
MGGSLRVHRLVIVEDTDLAVDGLAEDPLSGVTRRRSCWNGIGEWSMVPDLAMGRSDVVVWGQESLYGFSTPVGQGDITCHHVLGDLTLEESP